MGKHRFQQRFIAFVDVLGFRTIVKRMSREDRLFTTVRDAFKDVDSPIKQEISRELQQIQARVEAEQKNSGTTRDVPSKTYAEKAASPTTTPSRKGK